MLYQSENDENARHVFLALEAAIERIIPQDPVFNRLLADNFTHTHYPRGKHLLRIGQRADAYWFVADGCLRIYYQLGLQTITAHLVESGSFFWELNSLIEHAPSEYGVETLAQTDIMSLPAHQVEQWRQAGYPIDTFLLQVVQNGARALLTEFRKFQCYTAEQRYDQLLHQGSWLRQASLQHLASYLGITPTSLSRIRRIQMSKAR
jgi:CRP-like cAMP-binding protein